MVDPSAELLKQAPAGLLRTRVADAAAFARRPEPFDKLLIKEMIHHLPPGERPGLLAKLAAAVEPGGRLLVVLLPFDDEELEAGIEELLAAHPEPELRYTYRLAFVAAAA